MNSDGDTKRTFKDSQNNHYLELKLFGAERTELLTNLLTLGITDVNLSLLLIGCDDYDENLIRMYLNLFIIS